MRAITIAHPHAWAVIYGDKPYENRNWPCNYEGPLLIHAALSRNWLAEEARYPGQPPDGQLAFGAMIGIVDMKGSKNLFDLAKQGIDHPTIEGPHCHIYRRPRALDQPIYCRGQLGLWTPAEDVVVAVLSQLEQPIMQGGARR